MNLPAALTHKIGPLPAGAWLAAAAGGLYISRHRTAGDAGTTATPATDATGSGDPIDPSPDNAPLIITPVFYLPGGGGSSSTPVDPPAAVPPATDVPSSPAPSPTPVTNPTSSTPHTAHATTPAKSTTKKPAKPSGSAYIVRPGDTLSKIGARKGVDWQAIYAANRAVIESTAKRHGFSSSDGGHWIFAGELLRIPR